MMEAAIVSEKTPHLRKRVSTTWMLADVLIALAPAMIFSFFFAGWRALMMYGISDTVMLLAEFVFVGLKFQPPRAARKGVRESFRIAYSHYSPHNVLAPLVTSHIFCLIMPASAEWYTIFASALFGIVVGKLVFGGLGSNIFNPAAAARIFASICFGSQFSYPEVSNFFATGGSAGGSAAVVTGGTPLGVLTDNFGNIGNYDLQTLFLGFKWTGDGALFLPGTIGETCKLAILIGAIYLFARRNADLRVTLSLLFTFTVVIAFSGLAVWSVDRSLNVGNYILYHLLSGGLLFGAVFMATDPVTSPNAKVGRIAFGTILAILIIVIRLFAATPEGVAFAILIGNALVPLIDDPRLKGNRYRWYHPFIWLGVVGIMVGILFMAIPAAM